MGKRSNFEHIPRDFFPTPYAAVPPLIPHLRGTSRAKRTGAAGSEEPTRGANDGP